MTRPRRMKRLPLVDLWLRARAMNRIRSSCRHYDGTPHKTSGKPRIRALHHVKGNILRLYELQVSAGNYLIGVDIVTEPVCPPLNDQSSKPPSQIFSGVGDPSPDSRCCHRSR